MVSAPGQGRYNPVQLSFDVVGAASDASRSHIRWDYRQEDPVNDARGTRLETRGGPTPDLLTDAPQLNITNVIAPYGGRIYVDHAHPEYSAPETDPFEAVRYDRAGDLIMRAAGSQGKRDDGTEIVLHRNNVDGKGASWGTHENYMMLRSVPFDLVDTPHDHALRLPTDLHRLWPRRHRRT